MSHTYLKCPTSNGSSIPVHYPFGPTPNTLLLIVGCSGPDALLHIAGCPTRNALLRITGCPTPNDLLQINVPYLV